MVSLSRDGMFLSSVRWSAASSASTASLIDPSSELVDGVGFQGVDFMFRGWLGADLWFGIQTPPKAH